MAPNIKIQMKLQTDWFNDTGRFLWIHFDIADGRSCRVSLPLSGTWLCYSVQNLSLESDRAAVLMRQTCVVTTAQLQPWLHQIEVGTALNVAHILTDINKCSDPCFRQVWGLGNLHRLWVSLSLDVYCPTAAPCRSYVIVKAAQTRKHVSQRVTDSISYI